MLRGLFLVDEVILSPVSFHLENKPRNTNWLEKKKNELHLVTTRCFLEDITVIKPNKS